jgi:hypothetical protein
MASAREGVHLEMRDDRPFVGDEMEYITPIAVMGENQGRT